MRGELDSVIRDELVDVAVLVAFRLCMADQNDHLHLPLAAVLGRRPWTYTGLTHVGWY